MESHSATRSLADYELDSLRERNVGKSEWLAIPVDGDLKQNGRIWLRKDRLVAAFAVKKPIAGPYRLTWLTTSFTLGYLEVLKLQINKGDLVADLPTTRSLWTNLEKFLESHSK